MFNNTTLTQQLEISAFIITQFSLTTLTLVSNIVLVAIVAFSKNLHDLSYNFIINVSISDIISSVVTYVYALTAIPIVSMSRPVGVVELIIQPQIATTFPYGNIFNVVYFSITLLFVYLILGIIMLRNYKRIAISLSSQISNNTAISLGREASINRARNVIRVFIIATLAQILMTLPYILSVLIYSILNRNQFQFLADNPQLSVIILLSLVINIASYLVNPFIFLVFDKNIRIAAHDLYLRFHDHCSHKKS
ncbi:hypothetical protein TrispH2_012140 [Trichoplax sp. H2]|nr:hypothetical protein TrispH2_012140 [Trichoplax sp. H2]|eukprot:RDD35939.1 hypothetical protein TrispH2_012140 [Trichoplax sp. H2]